MSITGLGGDMAPDDDTLDDFEALPFEDENDDDDDFTGVPA
jgi:hypothetical protein